MIQHKTKLAVALLIAMTGSASALEKGDWIGRIGATNFATDTSSGTVDIIGPPLSSLAGTAADTGDRTGLSGTIGYMITDKLELEALLGLPFKHAIKPNGGLSTALAGLGVTGPADIGETKHLPPIVSVNYHFMPKSKWRPYVGVGVNYTKFFSEKTSGGLAEAGYTDLKLDDSWGWAAQVGIDVDISKNWFLNATIRKANIETEAKINGGALGPLQIKDIDLDPTGYSIQIGRVF